MFVPLHHHLESRNEDSPGNVAGSELIQHSLVDIIVAKCSLSGFLRVTIVETKRFALSFVLCQRCFSIPLSSFCFFSLEMLIKWLSSALRNLGRFYLLGKMFLEFALISGYLLLKPNLASWLSFVRVLLELKQYWYSHIILALASFGNHVLFVHKFLLEWAF